MLLNKSFRMGLRTAAHGAGSQPSLSPPSFIPFPLPPIICVAWGGPSRGPSDRAERLGGETSPACRSSSFQNGAARGCAAAPQTSRARTKSAARILTRCEDRRAQRTACGSLAIGVCGKLVKGPSALKVESCLEVESRSTPRVDQQIGAPWPHGQDLTGGRRALVGTARLSPPRAGGGRHMGRHPPQQTCPGQTGGGRAS